MLVACVYFFFFFFNDAAPPEIYTLPLRAALPIPTGGVAHPTRLSTGMGIAHLTVGQNHALHAQRLERRAPRRAVPRALDDLSAVPLCRARRRRGRGRAVAA